MKIERFDLVNEVKSKLGRFPIVFLIGLRQVGKTTLSKSLFIENVKYFDLESPRDFELLNEDAASFLENYKDQLVVIDEVQLLPKFFSELRPIVDANDKNGQFILLGSANPSKVKGVSESLTGRAAYIDISPLDMKEVGSENMIKRWLRGGLPKAFLANDNDETFDWLDQYLRSYIERDINLLFGINLNAQTVRRCLRMIASINGATLNIADLSRSLGISAATTNHYLDVLEAGNFIYKLNPFHANITKRLVKSPKVYIADEGILHSLLQVKSHESLLESAVVGASWEGFVISQIRSKIKNRFELCFFRTQVGAEIDLVLVKNNRPVVAIEIKHSNTPSVSRGFYSSCDELMIEHRYIITKNEGGYKLKNAKVVAFSEFIASELDGLLS
jgi:uncharacterized protein